MTPMNRDVALLRGVGRQVDAGQGSVFWGIKKLVLACYWFGMGYNLLKRIK